MITPAAGKLLSTAIAAAACFFFLLRIIISLKSLIFLIARLYRWTEGHTQAHQTFTIPRQADDDLPENPLYRKAAAYVAALPAAEDSDHTSLLSSFSRPNDLSVHLIPGQIVLDSFFGARLSWTFVSPAGSGDALVLRLRRQDRHRVLRPYLRHVESVAEEIEIRRKEIKLYTNAAGSVGRRWRSVTMSHPATFDTLVMDPEFKARVRADLELFLKGRAYYARLGRVWKRSYFLYGPPGTGKSSFVVAMARFLGYNVYDLDLSLIPPKLLPPCYMKEFHSCIKLTGWPSLSSGKLTVSANSLARFSRPIAQKSTQAVSLTGRSILAVTRRPASATSPANGLFLSHEKLITPTNSLVYFSHSVAQKLIAPVNSK
ncbi:AAA-ATPase At2g46620-like [Phalaenopsis equestris]|uniref:AAA-ATPase At2g46620-like n=1 Tax=Phalaenopsis equestris TaxID=78828 RepID=UPI0009E30DD5|nr:AAA-ATPase At2g46620-like [Phalaenopsis equestris]